MDDYKGLNKGFTPPPPNDIEVLLLMLKTTIASVVDAQSTVTKLWEVEPACRTPRMAEVCSLLERAKKKLEADSKEHQRKATKKEDE